MRCGKKERREKRVEEVRGEAEERGRKEIKGGGKEMRCRNKERRGNMKGEERRDE